MDPELRDSFPMHRQSVFNIERRVTNKIVGIIFLISFLLWLVVAIYGVAIPLNDEDKSSLVYTNFNTERIFTAVGFMLLSAVFTVIMYIALRWIPNISSVTLWLIWLQVPVFIFGMINQISFYSVLSAVGSILSCLLLLILLKTEWFHLTEAILKDACKMLMSVPSVLVFAFFTYLLNAFVIGITFTAIIKLFLSPTTFLSMLAILLNIFFGIWTMIVIGTLSWMTVSGTFAEYYNAEDKGSVSLGTVLDLFKINCRYHIGTAAMYYPILGGLRALFYVIVLGVSLIIAGANKTIVCFVIYNIFDPVLLRIIYMGGVTTSGIKGTEFYDSMADTMTHFVDNAKSFLTVVKVTELLMGISSALVMLFTTLSTFGYIGTLDTNKTNSWQLMFIYLVLLGGFIFLATLFSCLAAACYSILLCLCGEISSGVPASPNSCIMSPNLHSALNHSGPPSWFRNCCGCIPDFEYNPNH